MKQKREPDLIGGSLEFCMMVAAREGRSVLRSESDDDSVSSSSSEDRDLIILPWQGNMNCMHFDVFLSRLSSFISCEKKTGKI